MKKLHLLLIGALLFTACQPKAKTDAATASATPDYPYKIKNPDNWMMDTTTTNTMLALKALKTYETKDTTAMAKYIGDSILFNYDGGVYKGKGSGFVKMTGDMVATLKSIKITMHDWEAVVGKNTKEQWVTLWYTEYDTDPKGKVDSIDYVNDLLFKDGKIVRLDEYGRKYKPAGK